MHKNRNDALFSFHSLSFMHGKGESSTVDNNTIIIMKTVKKDELTLTVWLVDSGTPVAIYHQTGVGQVWSDGFVMTDAVLSKLVSACAHYLNEDRILTAMPVVFALGQVVDSDAILNAIEKTRILETFLVEMPDDDSGKYVNYKISNGELAIVGIRQATVEQATLFSGEGLNVTGYSKKTDPISNKVIGAQHYVPTVRIAEDKYICSVPFYVDSVSLTFVG